MKVAGQEHHREAMLMSRLRYAAGLIAASWLVLSSAAHSFVGWRQLHDRLTASGAPADLAFAVQAGWQFAGVAMLCFAIIVIVMLRTRYRDPSVSAVPVHVIGMAYAAYGAWALIVSKGDLFFLIFIIPGLLLLGAAPWRRESRGA